MSSHLVTPDVRRRVAGELTGCANGATDGDPAATVGAPGRLPRYRRAFWLSTAPGRMNRRGVGAAARVATALAVALAAGCGPAPAPWATAFDPVAALPLAEVRREAPELMPPPHNPAARAAGWLPADAGEPHRSRGPASELTTFVVSPRPLALLMRAEPAVDGREPQRVKVAVNGSRAGEVVLAKGVGDYRLELPAELLRAGDNHLRFEYAWTKDPGGSGQRQLAVAWHELRLASETPAAPRRAGDHLELPLGTLVEWYFTVVGAAVLELPGLRGPEGSRLRVTAQSAGGDEQELAVLSPGSRRRWLELPAGHEPVVRLSFAAVPGERPGATGVLRVERPRVLGRAAAEPATTPVAPGSAPVAAGGPSPAVALAAPTVMPPPILIYMVDTLRADRIGVYGCECPLTPHIDRFAAGATLFRRAVAQAPWTRPSVASLFTGRGPLRHGVTRIEHRLPAATVTLAELLRDHGYRTAAISTNAHVTRATGLTQGFEAVELIPRQPAAEHAQRLALQWLDGPRGDGPYLLYLHVLEPHAPYSPPADLRARFAPEAPAGAGSREWLERLYRARGPERRALARPLPDLYDGEVAAADRDFGAFRAELERRGEWDRLLVVFLSDHGEALGERGAVGHAQDLFQEALAVPFLVKWPGQRDGEVVDAVVQHVDLLPTLLAAAGLPASGGEGLDLGARLDTDRPAISHLDYRGRVGMSVVWGRWKWIEPLTPRFAAAPALYDLVADPGETSDLMAAEPVVAGWLRTLLRAERLAASASSEQAELDEETREALTALGYL